MKIFKKVIFIGLAAMMALSVMSVGVFATDISNSNVNDLQYYANMNLETADAVTKDKIIAARNKIIYSTEWVADGYTASVGDIFTGETIRELPQFSDVFPDWELPIEDTSNAEIIEINEPLLEASALFPLASLKRY